MLTMLLTPLLTSLLVSVGIAQPILETRALPPSIDPFYQPPAGFESTAPGTVLRTRPVVASFLGLVPVAVDAHQLLYRTTAINGSAIATATTIFRPLNAKTDRFVSFQTAYDSSASICNPSYNYQLGAVQTDLISSIEQLLLQGYLNDGYIVASSDYEGPDAAFSAGRLSGMGVLDGMRAVSNAKNTLGLSTSTPMIVGAGYSGGAIATGWAASLQPKYAPELNIKGWAAGGTPSNLTGTLVFTDGELFSGFLPPSLDGLSRPSAYGAQLAPLISSIITPYGASKLTFSNANCAPADILNFAEQSVLSTDFQTLGEALLYNPTIQSVLQQNTMGVNANETPTAPVFLYHASQDEIIPYLNASTLYNDWCEQGASVQFTTFANGGHFTTEILGTPGAVKFATAAFAGTLPKGCSQSTVLDDTLDPLALGVQVEPVLVELINALAQVGKGDANLISDLSLIKTPVAASS